MGQNVRTSVLALRRLTDVGIRGHLKIESQRELRQAPSFNVKDCQGEQGGVSATCCKVSVSGLCLGRREDSASSASSSSCFFASSKEMRTWSNVVQAMQACQACQ